MIQTRSQRPRGSVLLLTVPTALLLAAACSEAGVASVPSEPGVEAAEPTATLATATVPTATVSRGPGAAPESAAQDDERTPPEPKRVVPARKVPKVGETPPQEVTPPGDEHGDEGDHDHEGDHEGHTPPAPPQYAGEKDPDAKLAIDFGLEKHDFGPARQGDLLEHTFVLESAGKNPVKIRQASPTCGCTVSEIRVQTGADPEPQPYKMGDPIEPSSKVHITGKIDTTSKSNKTQVRINVYTNDPIGLTQLALSADIEPFIRATPGFVNLGDIRENEEKTQVIDIRTSHGEPVLLQNDPANPIKVPPGMTVDLEPVQPGEDGRSSHWRATVKVGQGTKEGPIGYQLRLVSDHEMPSKKLGDHATPPAGAQPEYYKVNASVNGRVLGVLSYTPQFLSMGLVRPGQRATRTAKVISHDEGFSLADVKVRIEGETGQELAWKEYFSATVKPATGMEGAVDVELRLDGLPDGADGSFRGVMVIETGHPDKPELQVRFSGVCRAGITKPAPTQPIGDGE